MAADALYVDLDYVDDGYVIEGVSVNWATGEIFVPREYMELVQSNPTEIRKLDSNAFRLTLKDLEDDPIGMSYKDTHRHNTSVLLGGIEYARIIEILEPYTITFEDGRYAVQITGSNNNIGDRVNVNNVSVRSANSAGLIQTREIEFNTFAGGVTIDQANGVSGQTYPTGTPIRPVNNIADARFIAQSRGFSTFYVLGDLTLDEGDDVSGFLLMGSNASRSFITINSASDTAAVEIRNCTITGVLDGGTIIRDSYVFDLSYVNGFMFHCELAGTIQLGGGFPAHIMQCFAEINQTTIDLGGSGNGLNMQQCSGRYRFVNKTGADLASIHITSGNIEIDSSVTNTTGMCIAGVGTVIDNSTGGVDCDAMLSGASISGAIWDTTLAAHQTTGSAGKALSTAGTGGVDLGLMAQTVWEYVDRTLTESAPAGLTPEESARLTLIERILRNKTVTDPTSGIMTVYADDGVTPLLTANIFENTAKTQPYRGQGVEVRERLV